MKLDKIETTQKKKNKKAIIISISIIAVLMVAGLASWLLLKDSDNDIVKFAKNAISGSMMEDALVSTKLKEDLQAANDKHQEKINELGRLKDQLRNGKATQEEVDELQAEENALAKRCSELKEQYSKQLDNNGDKEDGKDEEDKEDDDKDDGEEEDKEDDLTPEDIFDLESNLDALGFGFSHAGNYGKNAYYVTNLEYEYDTDTTDTVMVSTGEPLYALMKDKKLTGWTDKSEPTKVKPPYAIDPGKEPKKEDYGITTDKKWYQGISLSDGYDKWVENGRPQEPRCEALGFS